MKYDLVYDDTKIQQGILSLKDCIEGKPYGEFNLQGWTVILSKKLKKIKNNPSVEKVIATLATYHEPDNKLFFSETSMKGLREFKNELDNHFVIESIFKSEVQNRE